MNSRLEDLMYRAGLTAQGCWDSMDDYDHRAIEKFALLIVRESIEVVKDSQGYNQYFPHVAENIKQHFGVE
jgi:hypothetical protein